MYLSYRLGTVVQLSPRGHRCFTATTDEAKSSPAARRGGRAYWTKVQLDWRAAGDRVFAERRVSLSGWRAIRGDMKMRQFFSVIPPLPCWV